ncbi:membrane protein insertion efficiency factor YidD [uncultured Amnibacterium sp.]|uniref:membrane protein insertion efficiency factor YidD n=1 Tax=uncultured Amnibacterium sp. TaxID=1631851 RepID=UPI0035CC8E74
MTGALLTVLLVPRNLGVLVLKLYRAVVSPLYGDVCRYHPSCSRYALEAVQQSGLMIGSALALFRIVRCNPWSRGGVDDPPQRLRARYRITPLGFVGLARPGRA